MEAAPTAEARRFGKYTLVAKLATGGMAEIFLARLNGDGGFEKLVCIKRILPHLARDPRFVAMFLDEARVAARISHPNVCQVFELGELAGQYYIAMEYLEGVPLSCFRRLDYYPLPPDPRLVAGFGIQACEGLHHAHQLKRPDGELLGVIHRDVSPQNLFVTVDGILKVLDFGIAKVTDASVRTSTGAVKGTYAYMAPEQLRNEVLDRRTDVWALGIVLWEVLAQRHLFRRDTEFLTFQAITQEPIPNICELRPDVPPLLGDTIMRALSRDREQRFASARGLGEALAQAVAPLGGPFAPPALSDEISERFASMLAEQQTLLRIAREGGQFDLDAESALVGHGTALATTPVSSLRRELAVAKAEVAQLAAARQAIDSLDADHSSSGFTPPPGDVGRPELSRRSRAHEVAAPGSPPVEVPARRSQPYDAASPYAVAPEAWRSGLHDAAPGAPPRPTQTTAVVAAPSRLPWIVAVVAVGVAGVAGTLLFVNLRGSKAPARGTPSAPVATIAMHHTMAAPPAAGSATPVAAGSATAVVAGAAAAPDPARAAADAGTTRRAHPGSAAATSSTPADSHPPHRHAAASHHAEARRPTGPPGFITIDSAPVYAVIYVDGKKLGDTPLVHIALSPGRHTVRAISPSGGKRTVTIQIASGKTAPARRIEW